MFKKLKDRIAEEVKQSPGRIQDIINSAQVGKCSRNVKIRGKFESGMKKRKTIKI